MNLNALNEMDLETFTKQLADIFEHSPWVAREAARKKPFASIDELHAAMVSAVREASPERKKALIEAHPRLGSQEKLTAESEREQKDAGVHRLRGAEAKSFAALNQAYEQRFGFPFILAVRGLARQEVETAMKKRLTHSVEEEFSAALDEICKIARFRLEDKFQETEPSIRSSQHASNQQSDKNRLPEPGSNHSGELTTHLLDLANGRPAADVRIDLFEVDGEALMPLKSDKTNADGRMSTPLLDADAFHSGTYELHVHIGSYFRQKGNTQSRRPFLDIVTVRFGVADASEHYHVPLLISPWGYHVYRGS